MDNSDTAGSEASMDPSTLEVLRVATSNGVWPQSLALYARWWQLETWVRELAYVELRALYGLGWTTAVNSAAHRQSQDAQYAHMVGADNENPLAYLDYSQLVDTVINDHWSQLGYALVETESWRGRQNELRRIRHRIGHMRRPHPDDLGRLEQTLRDLERGAFMALESYSRRTEPNPSRWQDPVTIGWILGLHDDARRLIRHAERQYETSLLVRASRRPWSKWPKDLERAEGLLWHAEFILRDRTIDVADLWHDSAISSIQPLIVHLVGDNPWHVGFTFAAVDDSTAVADAIGRAFDAVLLVSRPQYGPVDDGYWEDWKRRAQGVDYRVLVGSGWGTVNEGTLPISIFSAGGGVRSAPSW